MGKHWICYKSWPVAKKWIFDHKTGFYKTTHGIRTEEQFLKYLKTGIKEWDVWNKHRFPPEILFEDQNVICIEINNAKQFWIAIPDCKFKISRTARMSWLSVWNSKNHTVGSFYRRWKE